MICADTSPADWISNRFDWACYFYPSRDCPGWQPGTACSRIGQVIPNDT